MFSIEVGVGKCVGAGGVAHGKLGVVDELVAVRGKRQGCWTSWLQRREPRCGGPRPGDDEGLAKGKG